MYMSDYDESDKDNDSADVQETEAHKILDYPNGKLLSKTEAQFFNDLKKILADDNLYFDFPDQKESLYTIVLKAFSLYVEGVCGADELFELLEEPFRHIDEFEQFKNFCLSREANRRKEDSWYFKNWDEANLKDSERIDHSYSTLPESFPISIYTGQKGSMLADVINHIWVSVPCGSEGNFTFKQKNKHEDALFKIEDERYELDQCIDLCADAIKALESAAESIEAQGQDYIFDSSILTPPRMAWIYQTWAKNSKVLEYIKEHPINSIPQVLNTMRAFLADFNRKKSDMKNNFRQECNKHWSKSLDHKSFYFRQNEKKTQLIREFLNQMQEKIKLFNVSKDEEIQKKALQFYTGFEGQEASCLNYQVKDSIEESHPMLLNDPIYLENFEKLPQFRFLIDDEDCLKLVIKYLYVSIENQSGQTHRQKDFLVSFAKYFLNTGFVKKDLDKLKIIELPEDFPDFIKNTKEFYLKYEKGEIDLKGTFGSFFFDSKEDEILVNVGTTRKDFFKDGNLARPTPDNEILESDSGDSEEDEENQDEHHRDKKFQSYLYYDEKYDFNEQVNSSRFLPLFTDDQTLFYGTKHFYFSLRYFITLYERLKLIRIAVEKKCREDLKNLKEENKYDTSKLEEDFEKLVQVRYQ